MTDEDREKIRQAARDILAVIGPPTLVVKEPAPDASAFTERARLRADNEALRNELRLVRQFLEPTKLVVEHDSADIVVGYVDPMLGGRIRQAIEKARAK